MPTINRAGTEPLESSPPRRDVEPLHSTPEVNVELPKNPSLILENEDLALEGDICLKIHQQENNLVHILEQIRGDYDSGASIDHSRIKFTDNSSSLEAVNHILRHDLT